MTSVTDRAHLDRGTALDRLRREHFDLLVVGGGITGAGVALDAASRGLRTALVDKGDFAAGTSSQSSKLVHGGLRYLQQYEIGLVFQSLAERQRLLHNAPHLVEPQVFVIPLFGTGGVVDRTIARTYSIGLWMYDTIGGFRIGHRHRRISAEEVHRHLPTLDLERLVAGFLYYDARADDARLTLAIVKSAAAQGAAVANHAAVTSLGKDASGRVVGATVLPDGWSEPIDVHAAVVVNATGVWADRVRDLDSGHAPMMRPAKGIHIALDAARLPCDVAAVLPSPSDGRNVFVIPWDGKTYVGTTDTAFDGDLDDPGVTTADVDYLLAAVNAAVTEPVGRDDVTGTWSGLRPLLAAAPGRRRAPSERTADLSRRHRVLVDPSGLVTVTGGKLTTYRAMAADTVDAAERLQGRRHSRSVTRQLVLVGSGDLDRHRAPGAAAAAGLDQERYAHLLARYGSEVANVAAVVAERPGWGDRLVPTLPFLAGEVVWAVRAEMALTLDDVLSRRMRALAFDAAAAAAAAPPAAELMAAELGWDAERTDREVGAFIELVDAEAAALVPEESAAA